MDAIRIGTTLRRLRVRAGMRQVDVADRAGVSQGLVSRVECGRSSHIAVATWERIFAAVGASLHMEIRWRGPALDRLLDERHAALVETSVSRLVAAGWDVDVEVSYSVYGERGSIDALGHQIERRAVVVEEIKADIVRIDDTIRKLDEKARLVAGGLARSRFGWQPVVVGRILVLPDTDRARRQVRAHAATLDAAFPSRGEAVRAWLRDPVGPMAGILFVANMTGGRTTRTRAGVQRVRVVKRAGNRPRTASRRRGSAVCTTRGHVRDGSG